jgi:hypothetical protein
MQTSPGDVRMQFSHLGMKWTNILQITTCALYYFGLFWLTNGNKKICDFIT